MNDDDLDMDSDGDMDGDTATEPTMKNAGSKPGSQWYRDKHDWLGAGKDMATHHKALVEAPHAMEDMDAMTGEIDQKMAECKAMHGKHYPDEEPIEDYQEESGMGGDDEPAGQETEETADETQADEVTKSRTRKSNTRRVTPAHSAKSYDPTERTYQRLLAEEQCLLAEMAGD